MVYLERHKEKVLEAAEKGQEFKKGYFGSAAVSRETAAENGGFDSVSISKALGVSRQDTLLAIQLFRAHEERRGLPSVVGGLKEDGRKLEEGDPELAAWRAAREALVPKGPTQMEMHLP